MHRPTLHDWMTTMQGCMKNAGSALPNAVPLKPHVHSIPQSQNREHNFGPIRDVKNQDAAFSTAQAASKRSLAESLC